MGAIPGLALGAAVRRAHLDAVLVPGAPVKLRDLLRRDVTGAKAWDRWRRVEVGPQELEDWARRKCTVHARVFVGAESITVATTRTKYVDYRCCGLVTTGELARAYLVRTGAYVGARPWAPGFAWNPPLYCLPPGRPRNLCYVDLRRAYWQIVYPAFRPDDAIVMGMVVPGQARWWRPRELAADRELRHAVIGHVFAHSIGYLRYGEPVEVAATRHWANPTLRQEVMCVLHALAAEARSRYHLSAWLTDAAIVDAREGQDLVKWLWHDWHIEATVVAMGMGDVWSTTRYRIGGPGGKWTEEFRHGLSTKGLERHPHDNLMRIPGTKAALRRRRRDLLAS